MSHNIFFIFDLCLEIDNTDLRFCVYRFILHTTSNRERFRFARNPRRLINFHNTLKLIFRPTVAASDAVYPLVFD